MKFIFSQEQAVDNELAKLQNKINKAKADAVQEAADIAVKEGQANVAQAAFASAQQVKSKFYPNTGDDPAALVYFNMPFAQVFEKGAKIAGQPLLWLPIRQNLPTGIKSPKQYGKKLVSVNIAGKPPLLFDAQNRLLGPLFFATRSVTIKKRLDLKRIFFNAGARVLELFEQRMKG